MSIHINAKKGEIAKTVLLPGDPLRAKYIAETFLDNPVCYNEVRGMYGFTGTYKGKPISIQGTGMGIPSISIYVEELINDFGAENLIRIGSCGSIQEDVKIRDVIIAMSASTDSNINTLRFKGKNFAPTANFELFQSAVEIAKEKNISIKSGNVVTHDLFYQDDEFEWKQWAEFGSLAVEMEVAGLYSLGAKYGVNTLALLTVSDSLITHEETTSEEREKTFNEMIQIALNLA